MDFEALKNKINNLNCYSQKELIKFEKELVISPEDFAMIFLGARFDELDVNKLPYVIDILYRSKNRFNFLLCILLLDFTFTQLPFLTQLEKYPISLEKFKEIKHTLVTVYAETDGDICNCMALILVINDPKFKYLDKPELDILVSATTRKLDEIVDYLECGYDIDDEICREIEILIDLACYMNKKKINRLVSKLSKYKLNFLCKLFITKYKIANNMNITKKEIRYLLDDKDELARVASALSKVNGLKYLDSEGVKQDDIALSTMIRWISYHNRLGKKPNKIEFIDTLEYNDEIFYIYKFKISNYNKRGYMLGVSGGYKKSVLSASSSLTYSEFEPVKVDYITQAKKLIDVSVNIR